MEGAEQRILREDFEVFMGSRMLILVRDIEDVRNAGKAV
jgi:hypothetical protein